MKYILYAILLSLCFIAPLKAQLFIENGTTFKIEESGTIILEDMDLKNNGNLHATGGTLLFKEVNGNDDQVIGGTGTTTFNHITLSLPTQDLRLDTDIQIDGTIEFQQGHFELNNHDVTLGINAMIEGEGDISCFIGANGGEIIMTLPLNAPNQANPANIGAEISSSANLGLTTIKRGHQAQNNNGNTSIYRYYDISPANNTGLEATLRFHYMEGELNNIPENELELWRNPGTGWQYMGYSTRDVNNNYVELTDIDAFSKWTATNAANALPLELLHFEVQKIGERASLLKWETTFEQNNDGFEIQRSIGTIPAHNEDWEVLGFVEGKGAYQDINYYEFIDDAPAIGYNYYRLKQLDLNGDYEYSEVRLALFEDQNQSTVGAIFPNPVSHQTYVELPISLIELSQTTVFLFDPLGKLLFRYNMNLQKGNHLIKIDNLDLPAGMYPVKVLINDKAYSRKIIIQ